MPLDSHRFDTWLKESVGRELAFRLLLWLTISTLSVVLIVLSGSHPTRPFSGFMTRTWPLVTTLTKPVLCLCGLALLFKDLEHADAHTWGQSTYAGKIGGAVRRVAGDAILWLTGALVAGWVTMIIAVFLDSDERISSWEFIALFSGPVLVMIATGALVRRAEPSRWVDIVSTKALMLIYGLPLLLYLVFG